jgi:predicted transcriptional regulator
MKDKNMEQKTNIEQCRQRLDELIETYRDSRFENEIEAMKRYAEKDNKYAAGLSQGMAIADKTFVMVLRDIKQLLAA